MKKCSKRFSILLALCFVLTTTIFVSAPLSVSANNTTYYVDSSGGNDNNNGTSTSTPWQSLSKVNGHTFAPGDHILFKRGGQWTGQLHPLGSGASGSPIVIDAYSTGNLPSFNGNRATPDAVYFYNQQYIEINNLDIMNDDNTSVDATSGVYTGIHFVAQDYGICNHLYVMYCNIHNVDSYNNKDQGKNGAGIYYDVQGTTTSTRFNDVHIYNNTVKTTDWNGIRLYTTWNNKFGGSPAYNGATGVVIDSNYVDDICGNAIIPCYCTNPVIQYNYSQYAMQRDGGGSGGAAVAIWPWGCDNALFQYNEACFTQTTADGQAWDCDGQCNNTIYQYNYSHGNVGGCVLFAGANADFNNAPVFRYNISQNDSYGYMSFYGGPNSQGHLIYNNTIYVAPGKSAGFIFYGNNGLPHNMTFKNNIYYNAGTGGGVDSAFATIPGLVVDRNCYYGTYSSNITNLDAHKVTSNPMLVNPGSGGTNISMTDPNRLSGYKLLAGSPCIGAGANFSNNGGKDFWGNAVPASGAPCIGANEYQGGPTTLFSDDFETSPDNNWTVSSGTWAIVTDGTQMYKQSAAAGGWSSAGSSSWTDYTLTADVKPLTFGSGGAQSISFRYTDNNNRYLVSLQGSNTLQLQKYVGGTQTILASVAYTITTGTTYTVKVVASGSSLSVYVNNVLQLTATDTSFTSGKICLNMYNATGEYDNVTVTSGNPTTLFSDNFETSPDNNWTVSSGTWAIVTDGTQMYKQSAAAGGWSSAGSSSWTDYTLTADVKPLTFGSGGAQSISFRYTDNNNRYLVSLQGSNTLQLQKYVGGTQTILASVAYTITTGTIYTVKVVASGSSLSVYVNNVLQLTATDTSFTSGKICLNMYNATGEYDNVTVSP